MEKYVGTGIFTKDGSEIKSFSCEYYLTHKKEIDKELFKILGDEYVEYCPKRKQNIVKEDEAEYYSDTNKKHDKLFKDLFSDREEIAKFINKYIKPKQEINKDDIEPYKTEFITKMFKTKEADIIYKIKDKNTFFLIEHQSTVDLSMVFRILNYKVAIMNQAIDKEKMKTIDYKYPNVIALVLYTGQGKWNAPTKLKQLQEAFENKTISVDNTEYVLVDADKKSIEELLNDNLITSKAMIMEKSKTKEEILTNFKLISTKIIGESSYLGEHLLNVLINYIFKQDIKDIATRILEEIKKKGENKVMLNCERVILEENARIRREGKAIGRREGKIIGIKSIAKKLISKNMPYEQIAEITELTVDEITALAKS